MQLLAPPPPYEEAIQYPLPGEISAPDGAFGAVASDADLASGVAECEPAMQVGGCCAVQSAAQ